MNRRALLTPLILMAVGALAAVLTAVGVGRTPTLGLDLQGGFSVVLQAKTVDGKVPSEEAVEKAKDIIRQRVDGLGVAEPDITRQGRTVIVQLPGVTNRKKAEGLVGCTAKLEFRPVLSSQANIPAEDTSTTVVDGATTTTATDGETTTTAAGDETTTTADATTTTAGDTADTTTTVASGEGDGETGSGVLGMGTGEGALPAQFAPSTTTTLPPTTTTEVPASTTTVAGETTTTVPVETSTTIPTIVPAEAAGCGEAGATTSESTTTTTEAAGATTTAPVDSAKANVQVPSDDGSLLYTLGPVGFTGDALSSAQAAIGGTGSWIINVSVKGSAKGEANTAFNACNSGAPECPAVADGTGSPGRVAIVLDGKVLSAPAVQSQNLADDTFQISGDFTEGDAKDLALVLRYGSLPVEFEQVALQQVSATLGRDTLNAGLVAGLVGIAILALYMFLYYRGFGLVVVASLFVWGGLMYGLVCFLSATQGLALTLAGITGIIVSVGTTVDTYVVVFERIKDEIRNGRSVRVATERGYKSGINTVFTANGAAFLGAFLLWILTVGPVRGFAYFLGLSVILDLGVAVLFTRPLVLLLGRSPRFARARFFGLGASTDQATLPTAKLPKAAKA